MKQKQLPSKEQKLQGERKYWFKAVIWHLIRITRTMLRKTKLVMYISKKETELQKW